MTDRRRMGSWVAATLGVVIAIVCALSFEQRAGAEDAVVDRFDHVGTRFILTGSHEGVACESCHARGVFRGTPTDCGFCHDGSGMRAESGKTLDHVPTTNRCDDCHTAFTWLEVRFEHTAARGTCTSCHNDVMAEGKPLDHVVTTSECDTCHNTFLWQSVRFDHANVTQPCSTCHNGVDATGKPAMDHVVTNSECDVCHSTRGWKPATFDHSDITNPCMSCHNGTDATGTPDGHFMTAQDCSSCHTTNAWRPDTFRHMSPNYPGDHAVDLDCTECHPGNSDPVLYKDDPGLAPDCAGCHRFDYDQGEHKWYENPQTDYPVEELKNCAGTCHVYEDATLNKINDFKSGEHSVNDRDFD